MRIIFDRNRGSWADYTWRIDPVARYTDIEFESWNDPSRRGRQAAREIEPEAQLRATQFRE